MKKLWNKLWKLKENGVSNRPWKVNNGIAFVHDETDEEK